MLWIECVHNTKINNFGSERALSVVRAQINVFDGFRKSAPDNRLSLSCSDLIQGRRFQRLILPSAPRLTCTLGGHSNFNRNIRSVRWVLVTKFGVNRSTEACINKMRSKKLNPAWSDVTFIGNMLWTKLLEGSVLQELIDLCSYSADCRTGKFYFSCIARGYGKLQLNGAELCSWRLQFATKWNYFCIIQNWAFPCQSCFVNREVLDCLAREGILGKD